MRVLSRLMLMSFFATLCFVSCKQDPALVEKREKQKTEITRLKGEIALMEEKLKQVPPDVSKELEAARKLSKEQVAEIERLDAEITGLQARKASLQQEFDNYRAKYQVK